MIIMIKWNTSAKKILAEVQRELDQFSIQTLNVEIHPPFGPCLSLLCSAESWFKKAALQQAKMSNRRLHERCLAASERICVNRSRRPVRYHGATVILAVLLLNRRQIDDAGLEIG